MQAISVIWWERSGSCGHILWWTHEYLKLWDEKHRFLNRWNRYGGGRAEYLSSMNEDCIMWRSIVWRGHNVKRTWCEEDSFGLETLFVVSSSRYDLAVVLSMFSQALGWSSWEANALLSSTARRALFPPRVSFSATYTISSSIER